MNPPPHNYSSFCAANGGFYDLESMHDIHLWAGNNEEINICNDRKINVGNDQTENIAGNFTQTVEKNSKTKINGNSWQKIIGSHDFFVSGPVNVKWDGANVNFHGGYTSDTFIGLKHSSFVGAQVSVNASYNLDITKGWKRSVCGAKELKKTEDKEEIVTFKYKVNAGTEIELKVGNSLLKISSDTIELNANHVVIDGKSGVYIKSSNGDVNIKSPSGDVHLMPSGKVTVPSGKLDSDDLQS